MKQAFKPLGVAAAVAAASAGYVNVANAQVVANNALGDLALVPYYTVNGNWVTGIHIVNTSDRTQVVKFRFRRALDSLDALDFNVVMSPEDVYAGTLRDDENGNIFWSANDSSCTSPVSGSGVALGMPSIYNPNGEGATGYVEIIGMGSPTYETLPLAEHAVHVGATTTTAGVPLDCEAVDAMFEANGTSVANPGNVNGELAWSPASAAGADGTAAKAGGPNTFVDTGNVLKVSYFLRDNDTGIEFGDNAVHIQNFLNKASITNQEFGWLSGDLDGFDFPDLDGTTPSTGDNGAYAPVRGLFNGLRAPSVLGVGQLINEWTANASNGAAVSWVVTMPGQYTMFDTPEYVAATFDDDEDTVCAKGVCDFRDIPVEVRVTTYDREEFTFTPTTPGKTVVSPSIPDGPPDATLLEKEVNVVTFNNNLVLGVSDNNVTPELPQDFGWATLTVSGYDDPRICAWVGTDLDAGVGARISDAALADLMSCEAADGAVSPASGNVPMIGFAAWARSVAANPDASYGRIVGHSFTS